MPIIAEETRPKRKQGRRWGLVLVAVLLLLPFPVGASLLAWLATEQSFLTIGGDVYDGRVCAPAEVSSLTQGLTIDEFHASANLQATCFYFRLGAYGYELRRIRGAVRRSREP